MKKYNVYSSADDFCRRNWFSSLAGVKNCYKERMNSKIRLAELEKQEQTKSVQAQKALANMQVALCNFRLNNLESNLK